MRNSLLALVVGLLAVAAPWALAQTGGPLNDLFALGQGFGQSPAKVSVATRAEPSDAAVPRAQCGAGSKTEPGIQGRVPANSANGGFNCNITQIGHQGASGGFKVLRYTDPAGHECAYYDTTLLFPSNAFHTDGKGTGVSVLDMSDPAHPTQTASLTEEPMLSPHESVNLNPKRGLIAAVSGNPATEPGVVTVYDASKDCRHPELQSTFPSARIGHESGFSADGKTFYATGTAMPGITAIDVSDPKNQHVVWHGNVTSHGMTLSDDGNRAYIADATAGEMLILDTSEIQARKANPQAREISRLTWQHASIPQNAIPFTRGGKPYVLEFDEYNAGTTGGGGRDDVGAARIIDISDETKPQVVANIRLQVNNPQDHAAANGDPGANSPVQGYAAHYCDLDSRTDPTVVACSFIASGLRVFDISDLTVPKEIAYFVAPTSPQPENFNQPSNFAMSKPAVIPERHEIWYSDGGTGFYSLRVSDSVWPSSKSTTTASRCLPRKLGVSARGVGAVKVGATSDRVRAKAGVPAFRITSRSLRYCVDGGGSVLAALDSKTKKVTSVFTTSKSHRARAVGRGTARAKAARRFKRSLRLRPSLTVLFRGRLAAGVKGKRVRFVGAVDRKRSKRSKLLRQDLRRLGL